MSTHILTVASDPNVRQGLKMALESFGYSVETADNGRDGLLQLERAPFTGLLLDIILPGLNGVEMLRKARQLYPTMPVVMMTGAPTIKLHNHVMAKGAKDVLAYPIEKEHLKQVVERWFGPAQIWQPTVTKQPIKNKRADWKAVLGLTLFLLVSVIWLIAPSVFRCTQPICRLIDIYTHEVTSLREYRQYLAGEDLYRLYRARGLTFNCDILRDQLASVYHEKMLDWSAPEKAGAVQQEMVRLSLLGARHDGRNLHLMNEMLVGEENLPAWATQIRSFFEREPKSKDEEVAGLEVRRLFDALVLHGGEKEVKVPLMDRYKCN